MEGWIKLHRKLLESSIFQNPDILKFWIWCLLKSTHCEFKPRVGIQEIKLEEGQFIFGRNVAADELKMNPSKVYRYLKQLQKEEVLSIKSNNKFTVVTIAKWATYQVEEEKLNNERTTSEQQANTYKNNKNIKNKDIGKKQPIKSKFDITIADSLWEAYPLKKGKSDAYKHIEKLINKGISQEQLLSCIENYKAQIKDPQFTYHGSTFFCSKWEDYTEEVKPKEVIKKKFV